jgi:hypothetical protein
VPMTSEIRVQEIVSSFGWTPVGRSSRRLTFRCLANRRCRRAALETHCFDSSGREVDPQAGTKMQVVAAAPALAFKFEPAQEVSFNGTAMSFAIGSLTNDNWHGLL